MLGERPPPARSLSSAGLRRGASSTDVTNVATLSGPLALEFTCRGPGPYRALWRLAIWLCKCLQPGRRFSWSSLEDGTALLQPGRRFCWSSLKDATAPLEPGRRFCWSSLEGRHCPAWAWRFCWSSLKDATALLEPGRRFCWSSLKDATPPFHSQLARTSHYSDNRYFRRAPLGRGRRNNICDYIYWIYGAPHIFSRGIERTSTNLCIMWDAHPNKRRSNTGVRVYLIQIVSMIL